MASITSSEFGKPLQSISLGRNYRVTPGLVISAPLTQRSGAPHPGLGTCWGWTPSGSVSLNCITRLDSVNKIDTEFFLDCVGFTTPSEGELRFYATPAVNAPPITMPLIVVPDVHPSSSEQTYPLSQVIELGQTVTLFPGAREFNASIGTVWSVIQAPSPFTWFPSGSPSLKLTPTTTAITYLLGPALTQVTWTIGI